MSLHAPIISAGDNELPDLVDGPDMRDTVIGQCRPMTLKIVSLTAGLGGDAVERSRLVETCGFLVAKKDTKLDIKGDGDGTRKWKLWSLVVLNDPKAEVGDKMVIKGVPHKIMNSEDFSQFGFFRFEIREDFRP